MSARTKEQWAQVKYSTTRLGGGVTQTGVSFPGGLDLATPSLALQPGALRGCLNFECAQSGGYTRIAGYERYDGRASPSAAIYDIIQFIAFTNPPSVGDTVNQLNTLATGVVVAVSNGTLPYIAVTQIVGDFNNSDIVMDGVFTVGAAIPTTVGVTSQQNAEYNAASADVYRALIGPVPGSGAILGVVGMVFNGINNVFAFRADPTASFVNIYKNSAAGWVQVPFFNQISFVNGGQPPNQNFDVPAGSTVVLSTSETVTGKVTVEGTLIIQQGNASVPLDGDTLTQGAVSATIQRVVFQSGAWNGGTAVGDFVITNPTGGNFAPGSATTSSGAVVVLTGAQAAIVLQPGGRYEFVKCNFSGQSSTRRIYGVDGMNQLFEFDGTTYVPIPTGNIPDMPTHIAFHKDFLFVSQQSSIFYCGAGTPFMWDAIDGGGEIATGDTVTGMLTLPGSQTTATLGVYMRTNTGFLYGIDPASFNFVLFNTSQGALPYSIQNLFDTFVFDDLGVITLRTTLNYGNFLPTTLTKNILAFIIQERTKIVASSVERSKSQYRVFFSDGYGMYLTMVNQQYFGVGIVLFPNPVYTIDEGEDDTGTEISYFGSSDGQGYVYQLDVGTSFDGSNIDAYITLAWDAMKTPRILKRYRAASIEIQGDGYAAVQFGYQLGYGTPLISQPNAVGYSTGFAPAPVWDSFTWDNFTWDGQTLLPTDVDMTGTGENVQVTITSTTNYIQPFTLNSIIYHYSMRRGIRV